MVGVKVKLQLTFEMNVKLLISLFLLYCNELAKFANLLPTRPE
jgi:ribosome-associated toxin RatA of RatAB toxin-antitoxin module